MEYYKIIKHPISTEKTVRGMEKDNKLVFIVDRQATKKEIKQALETGLKIKITNVNTMISSKGKKKAYVTLSKETPAIDVATQLGLM